MLSIFSMVTQQYPNCRRNRSLWKLLPKLSWFQIGDVANGYTYPKRLSVTVFKKYVYKMKFHVTT